jgi:hypothetical protein
MSVYDSPDVGVDKGQVHCPKKASESHWCERLAIDGKDGDGEVNSSWKPLESCSEEWHDADTLSLLSVLFV